MNSSGYYSTTSDSSAFRAWVSAYETSNSVNYLQHAFANLQGDENKTVQTSYGASSSADNGFLFTRAEDQNLAPVPVPLFSERIWAVDSFRNPGNSSLSTSFSVSENPLVLTPYLPSEANPFQNWGVDFLNCGVDVILLMAKDEYGSKYLQEISSSRDSRIVAKVFEMVLVFTLEVMTSQHGRFVFGKLIELCDEEQLNLITLEIFASSQHTLFLNASMDRHGSSCIKKLIRMRAKSWIISQIMSTLGNFFSFLMFSKPGSSIILQCLDSRYNKKNEIIYQAASQNCIRVANHERGCISMNKFIDEMRGPRRKQILDLISSNAVCLAKNPFGNYILQHVLELENPELIEKICLVLSSHFIDLSLRKGGSHVVEKCIHFQSILPFVVEEFLSSDRILEVANNSYGNYVIQTALRETEKANRVLHQRLVMKLQENLGALQFGHGRHVYCLITR